MDNAPTQTRIEVDWAPGDIQYADLDGDGEITVGDNTIENPGDRKVIGNTTPRYSFGLTTDLEYKGFFVNVFFQGVGKRDYWPSMGAFWPFSTQWFQVQKHFITDSWSEDNRDAYFSRPLARSDKNRQVQSRCSTPRMIRKMTITCYSDKLTSIITLKLLPIGDM